MDYDNEVYLYWSSQESKWVFSPGIGSNKIWVSSVCYYIDPKACKDWIAIGESISEISIECDDANVLITRKANISVILPGESLKNNESDNQNDTKSNRGTLFGLIGGCMLLFSITIIAGIIFSRKRRKISENQQNENHYLYRKSFMDFYRKYHSSIHYPESP